MAQKSQKAQATRNAATLKRTHLIALGVHGFYWLLRIVLFRRSLTRNAILLYILLSLPALGIEFFFERNSRPLYSADGRELKRSGEDLEAKGLTEWMWDILYWTWGCTVLTALLGDWLWWAYLAVPLYSAYLAYSTFASVRSGLGMGGAAAGQAEGTGTGATTGSKRQAKLEKRGGQRVQYR